MTAERRQIPEFPGPFRDTKMSAGPTPTCACFRLTFAPGGFHGLPGSGRHGRRAAGLGPGPHESEGMEERIEVVSWPTAAVDSAVVR